MMMKQKYMWIVVALAGLVVLPACREKGPAEKLGENIDKAVDDVKDKTKEVVDKVEDKTKEAVEKITPK